MKEVKAVFQPFMPKPVLEALQKVDHLPAATETEVDGYSGVYGARRHCGCHRPSSSKRGTYGQSWRRLHFRNRSETTVKIRIGERNDST